MYNGDNVTQILLVFYCKIKIQKKSFCRVDEERVLVELACGAALAAVYSGVIGRLQSEGNKNIFKLLNNTTEKNIIHLEWIQDDFHSLWVLCWSLYVEAAVWTCSNCPDSGNFCAKLQQ